MKRLIALTSPIAYLLTAPIAFAQQNSTINIIPPTQGYRSLGTFITAAINLAFIIAGIAVLIMLIWGAIEWIFSGGNKESVANARNRILHALIGLAILAVAFAIALVFGQFVGFNLLNFVVPNPNSSNPIQPTAIPQP